MNCDISSGSANKQNLIKRDSMIPYTLHSNDMDVLKIKTFGMNEIDLADKLKIEPLENWNFPLDLNIAQFDWIVWPDKPQNSSNLLQNPPKV